MYDALSLKFSGRAILDAQDIIGGALFLRLRAPWVVRCSSGSETGAFLRRRASSVVRCSSGSPDWPQLPGIRPGPGTIVPVPYPLPVES